VKNSLEETISKLDAINYPLVLSVPDKRTSAQQGEFHPSKELINQGGGGNLYTSVYKFINFFYFILGIIYPVTLRNIQ